LSNNVWHYWTFGVILATRARPFPRDRDHLLRESGKDRGRSFDYGDAQPAAGELFLKFAAPRHELACEFDTGGSAAADRHFDIALVFYGGVPERIPDPDRILE